MTENFENEMEIAKLPINSYKFFIVIRLIKLHQ